MTEINSPEVAAGNEAETKLPSTCYASIDIESTGVDPATDRILSVGVHKRWLPQNLTSGNEWKFNPGRPIPPESTKIHHITDEDVANEPPFTAARGKQIIEFIGKDSILVGYNHLRFDIPILIAELDRAGYQELWPPKDMLIVDACRIFHKKEPRDQAAALLKFCNQTPRKQHSALEDAEDAMDVLMGELRAYPDLAALPIQELAKFSHHDGMVDYSGKLTRKEDGTICYNFGNDRGKSVVQNPGLARWALQRNFPPDTRRWLEQLLEDSSQY